MRPLSIVAAGVLIFLFGCGTNGHSDADQIRKVLDAARIALLHDRPHQVCRLLTAHGRTRSLGFQVDFAEEGTRVPSKDPRLPQTCEAIVEREWTEVRRAQGAITWPRDLRHVHFSVTSVHDSAAKAQMKVDKPYGPVVRFSLRETAAGWRIDDSDAVPTGY